MNHARANAKTPIESPRERDGITPQLKRQRLDYAPARCREQEPSTPSIEMAFSKLKTLLRKAEERTVEALWNTIGQLVDGFKPGECANFLKAAGYDAD